MGFFVIPALLVTILILVMMVSLVVDHRNE